LIPVPPLTIRVESTSGPLANAEVLLGAKVPGELPNPDSGARFASYQRSQFVNRTAADGAVVYDRVALEYIEGLFVVARCEGYETGEREIRWDGKSPKEVRVLLARAPERALRIHCRDAPLAGGQVVFVDETPRWALWDTGDLVSTPYRSDLRSYPIGEDGSVRFSCGKWPRAAVVSAPEIGVRMVKLGELSGSRERTVTIEPGPRWEGRFVDGQGNPIEGIRVHIQDAGGGSRGPFAPRAAVGPLFRSSTDGDGRISLPRLAEASHWTECRIIVDHPAWEPVDRRELYLAPKPRTIVMRPVGATERIDVRLRTRIGASPPSTTHFQGWRWLRTDSKESKALLKAWGPVVHVASAGEWPMRAFRSHLDQDESSPNDVLRESGGARVLLWDVVVPDSGGRSPEDPHRGVEVLFLPPGDQR
jgi:hypothetical protein